MPLEAAVRPAVVVGAGIVGLAVAHHLRREGIEVTVVDRDPEGDKASFGNAGGIAVTEIVPASVPGLLWRVPSWLLDPLGPLAIRPAYAPRLLPWLWRFSRADRPGEVARIAKALSALNARVYDDLMPMLAEARLSGELHLRGALSVYESDAGFRRDEAEWSLKRAHGIAAEELSGADARAMEPALGSIVQRAIFTPQWAHVDDPRRLVDALRRWLQDSRQVEIVRGDVVDLVQAPDGPDVAHGDGRVLRAAHVVVAAGAWSGGLVRRLGDRVSLESERGYNMTFPDAGVKLDREVIFPERKFVATPLACGLRIGGAAEFGGLHARPNPRRAMALARLASRYLPGLKTREGTSWDGHRPATPDSLPVIGASPRRPNIHYAFGHGHFGLTQAATTGRIIADLIAGKPMTIDIAPYAIGRFG